MAQRVGRGIALLFHDCGIRRGWVVSSKPRPHFTPGKDPVPILQEAGWALGPVWTGGKSRPHQDSIPDRPARSQFLYRMNYLAHKCVCIFMEIKGKDVFCGHNILTEGVFLTQLSSHPGISLWRSVWVMINCSFMSDMWSLKPPSTRSVGAAMMTIHQYLLYSFQYQKCWLFIFRRQHPKMSDALPW